MKKTITKSYRSVGYATNGLKIVWNEEHNFRIAVFCSLFVLFFAFYFNFSFEEFVFCIIAITLVLSSEIINTAIEDLCNKVEPDQHPLIKKIKDTSATFVFISSFGALMMGILVFIHHFF
ncbi:MAG: diacylglycerol kinase family protein [Candidatus Paceibacterota bacterium]